MQQDEQRCRVAGLKPLGLDAEAGQSYWWCSCGRSAQQPLCDGSHRGTAFQPQEFQETASRKVWLCTCKATQTPPYCDGSHKYLPKGTALGDPLPDLEARD